MFHFLHAYLITNKIFKLFIVSIRLYYMYFIFYDFDFIFLFFISFHFIRLLSSLCPEDMEWTMDKCRAYQAWIPATWTTASISRQSIILEWVILTVPIWKWMVCGIRMEIERIIVEKNEKLLHHNDLQNNQIKSERWWTMIRGAETMHIGRSEMKRLSLS